MIIKQTGPILKQISQKGKGIITKTCPPKENLTNVLQTKFEDCDEDNTIEFNQWISTDRTQMITCSAKIGEFIDDLSSKLEKVVPHSYVAKSQSKYFKTLKEFSDANVATV